MGREGVSCRSPLGAPPALSFVGRTRDYSRTEA